MRLGLKKLVLFTMLFLCLIELVSFTSVLAIAASGSGTGINEKDFCSAINTPFSARAVDVDSKGTLYAVDWNGTVWSTKDQGVTWIMELATGASPASDYRSIIVTQDDNVHVAVGSTGIWRRNATGWYQTFSSRVNWGVWHFAENPLTGDLYLQTHSKIIYNSTDHGNSWRIMYDMATQDRPPIDDHFHVIAFDNATQTLWAAGGDTIDIIRRWNAKTGWETVASGLSGNKGQPTSIMFDDDFVYFGPDAQPYVFRLKKRATVPVNESDFEAVLTFDSDVWPDCQWSWECRKVGPIYYMATCYNDGIMYVSIDGIHWVSIFTRDGYYLEGYGTPADRNAPTKGGIASISSRLPVYFVCNTEIYSLNIAETEIKILWSQKFLEGNYEKISWICPVENGRNYVYLGNVDPRSIIDVKLSLQGLSVYENLENRTFEPNSNSGWTEEGYGTASVTNEDAHKGSWCLKDEVPAGEEHASILYPPKAQHWQIQSRGGGQYFLSVWLKTNVTWSGPQPAFYLTIGYCQNLAMYAYPVRINITKSWTQFAHSIYVPETADKISCWITLYRETGTSRTVYIDDAMFWGPLRTSLVSKDGQRFLSVGYTNSWSTEAVEYRTNNPSVTIGGKPYSYSGKLRNGSTSMIWSLSSIKALFCDGPLQFNVSMPGPPGSSGQCLLRIEVRTRRAQSRTYRS